MTTPINSEGPLTQTEQDELVERINANPYLQPNNSEGLGFAWTPIGNEASSQRDKSEGPKDNAQ